LSLIWQAVEKMWVMCRKDMPCPAGRRSALFRGVVQRPAAERGKHGKRYAGLVVVRLMQPYQGRDDENDPANRKPIPKGEIIPIITC
jgi:hypothetical protein